MLDKVKDLILGLSWVRVVLLIVIAGALFFYTLDQTDLKSKEDAIVVAKAKTTELNNKIEAAKRFEIEFEQRKKKYAEAVKQLQEVQGALPKQFFLPDVLNDLLTEARNVDLDVLSVNPEQSEQRHDLYSTLGIKLEARGTYLQLFVFLDRLANMKRLVGVSKLAMNKEGEASTSTHPTVRASIQILTYRYGGG